MILYNPSGDFTNYLGFLYVEEQFKLCGQDDWKPQNWGVGSEYVGVAAPQESTLVFDGKNIMVAENALYYMRANMVTLAYDLTEINSVSLIGGFNDWGGNVELSPS